MKETMILKIKSDSEPGKIAGAIYAFVKEEKAVELHAVGAGAVNQAIKSIITARGFVAPIGVNLVVVPGFMDVEMEGQTISGIKFILKEEK